MMDQVKFYRGSYDEFLAMQGIDENGIYFLTDTEEKDDKE